MAKPFPPPTSLSRDGTSQSARALQALSPAHVSVDERTAKDWLVFVRSLARTLRLADPEQPDADLDWTAFLGDDLDLERVAAYLRDPGSATAAEAERFGRPHFALLLVFLRLLGHAQDHVNSLTRRHLEFFYEQVLRLQRKPPTPDRVNLVFRPARGVSELRIPAGTELAAGKTPGETPGGAPLVYRTDRDLIVNRAEVAELRSLYIDQRVTGIREANERRDPGTDPKDRFVRMFEHALGEPRPGEPMPPYAGQLVDIQLLARLGALVRFAPERLFMELYELRAMMQLRLRRAQADAEWLEINRYLEHAGRQRTGNPGWLLQPDDPRRFTANLDKAIGTTVNAAYFAGLPEVKSIDDLYTQRLIQRQSQFGADEPSDVDLFIHQSLFFADLAEFDAMMALKTRSDDEWREVNLLLERAGQRRRNDRSYRLAPADPTAFTANFAAAIVGPGFAWPAGVASPESYYSALLDIEAYFYMSAEAFAYIMAAAPDAEATPKQWDRIYGMLTAAYQAKLHAARRSALLAMRVNGGLNAMLEGALGLEPGSANESLLPQIKPHITRAADDSFLVEVAARLAAANGNQAVLSAVEWQRVATILELAQRRREQRPEPVPRRIEWRNLYPRADATTAAVSLGLAGGQEQARWQTFGARPTERIEAPPATAFGWAIASPMLALAEGVRTVVLTLGFCKEGWQQAKIAAALDRKAFVVELTTEKAWVQPTTVVVALGDYATLSAVDRTLQTPLMAIRLTLTLALDVDAIAALAVKDSGIRASEPALRLSMRPIWDPVANQYITLYEPFAPLELAAVHLGTSVVGLHALTLQNDHGPLDPRRPFEPFGPAPAVGSRLLVGHPELIRNRLDTLGFLVEWMGAPKSLAAHYANYTFPDGVKPDNLKFTAQIGVVDHRRATTLAAAAPLFNETDARAAQTLKIAAPLPALPRSPEFTARRDLVDWRRYLQWELTPLDFQHAAYPRLAAQKSVELSAAIVNKQELKAADYQLAPPYTPKIKRLTVNYSTSAERLLDQPALVTPETTALETIFHVRPFGSHRIEREEGATWPRFLPAYDEGGELYIGLRDVQAPQQLALLLQMAEGSADPDLEPVAIEWSYLSGDRWISLHNGDLLRDTTRGLINTGIVELMLPAAAPSDQLPANLYWIRATIARLPDSVCDVVAIHAQATAATFVDPGDLPAHYEQPLPVGTIKSLVRHEPRLASVAQPYTSFGGRPGERAEGFYTRVSERLRHKQRALTVWDYERLVLERFPQVYKAKCLPAEHPDDPGRVEVIVIPDIRNQLPFDPFEPKAPADLLADIERHLAPRSPAFATVKARNARYVAVKARFGVRFKPGCDPGFYTRLLGEELCRFLSPWAYDDGADIAIGGRIYANSIISFVDQRDYVDYVATMKLFRSLNGLDFELVPPPAGPDSPGYFVGTERADEVLVAAREHDIDIINDITYDTELLSGINYMKVELDLIVG